ncbi:hypothetical protein DL764_004228 [Monosporascus ibericus]|uniref:Uncharacterized protein n=1 Tax=Monosporascus ibericus TaxID=155417 RepID=A0A4Q4TFD4_9PEZI|nr:hypothetical protein DL764_004228 [Monosporascus ibericus]
MIESSYVRHSPDEQGDIQLVDDFDSRVEASCHSESFVARSPDSRNDVAFAPEIDDGMSGTAHWNPGHPKSKRPKLQANDGVDRLALDAEIKLLTLLLPLPSQVNGFPPATGPAPTMTGTCGTVKWQRKRTTRRAPSCRWFIRADIPEEALIIISPAVPVGIGFRKTS